jgi:hypothetical protein
VDFSVSRARNVIAEFFIIGWDRYGFDKKRTGTLYSEPMFLHLVGSVGHQVYFGAFWTQNKIALFSYLVETSTDSTISALGHIYAELVFFASYGIFGSHSAFQCSLGMKFRRTTFHAQVVLVHFP